MAARGGHRVPEASASVSSPLPFHLSHEGEVEAKLQLRRYDLTGED